jgi:hypothetical protein
VIAVDPKSGAIRKRVVLDSVDIASTKELVTLRTNRERTRLYIANGSDESATILALPDLRIVREITIEGEQIRDAVPDPQGRFLYLLGRRVHVFDANGEKELRTLAIDEPSAIAASATMVVVAKGPIILRFDLPSFASNQGLAISDVGSIRTLLLAANNVVVAFTNGAFIEIATPPRFDPICLPEGSGPQIAALAPHDLVLFAERRCNSSSAFDTAAHRVTPASLYGISAYALAYEAASNTLAATDRAGFLTIYKVPRAAAAR